MTGKRNRRKNCIAVLSALWHIEADKKEAAKTIWDMGKTMSYVEKIMSDVNQTTSDLFLPLATV